MFDSIIFEQEQQDLLSSAAEAARNVSREERRKFLFLELAGGHNVINHQGLPGGSLAAYKGDIEPLSREGLLALSYGSHGTLQFDVTPRGFKYYEQMKIRSGEPVARVESETRRYLDAAAFRKDNLKAYQKWVEAEDKLWASDSQQQLTMIGHLCREAMQEFATALVERHQPPRVDSDKTHTLARVRAVLDQRRGPLGSTEQEFLVAILAYWGTVADLTQRQEHGAQKEGTPLTWEDGRRVVFQTAVVMFEIDRSLKRS